MQKLSTTDDLFEMPSQINHLHFLADMTVTNRVRVFFIFGQQAATTRVLELLGDPSRWEEARSLLSSPPLSPTDFATILDRYSDSNWGKHILGDLYRNQGLASIKVMWRA